MGEFIMRSLAFAAVLLATTSLLATADEAAPKSANFGGPDTVPNQIESDAMEALQGWGTRQGERWDAWKADVADKYGLGLGIDYSAVYLHASETVPGGQQDTGAGMMRFYGSWDAIGRESGNTGTFVWKFEHRHGYVDPAPSPLWAATELGYIGLMNAPFSDQGTRTTNFYWRQRMGQGRYTLLAGFLDVTDFLDIYGLASPWLHFTNFAFSTGSATIDVPNDATFGAGFGAMLSDHIYLVASLVDANSDPKAFWDSAENFFHDNEYFSSAEIGWTSGQGRIYFDNYHLTLWHKDEREDVDGLGNNKPSGWGANLSFARFVDDRWMPFLRAGYSEDGDSLLSKSVSTGIGYRLRENRDLLGFGLNWGKPNENQGAGDDTQYAGELFYRLMLGRRFNLTADLQYIRDPAANPDDDSIWVFGARGRLAF
jgi:porin